MRYKEIVVKKFPYYSINATKAEIFFSLFVLTHKEENNNKKEHYRRFQTQPIYIFSY